MPSDRFRAFASALSPHSDPGTPGTIETLGGGSEPDSEKFQAVRLFLTGEPQKTRGTPQTTSTLDEIRELPGSPCHACWRGLWWRTSGLFGGHGVWRCIQCDPPNPTDWIDGCAVPAGKS
jgi:hypothetical protein